MEERNSFLHFIASQGDKLVSQTVQHVGLTFMSLFIAILIGLPAGILIARRRRLAAPVLALTGVLQTIPSIALLGFMIPLLGIGPLPAITALFLYALLPIVRNTFTGITQVDPIVIEAAKGMGMSTRQIMLQVELPLAFPVLLAGIRTATVINVGVATLAAYIAAGGLGEFIFGGIALNNTNMILAGAIPAALLAVLFDFLLSRLQKMKFRRYRLLPWIFPLSIVLLSSFYFLPGATGKLKAGFTPEFMGREDGYLGLKSRYKLRLPIVVISDAMMYKAAYESKLDVISGYSTDGRIRAFDLTTLHDDRYIFPPYFAAPIVRAEVLEKYPQLAPAVNLLAGKINDSIMTALNYQVDYLNWSPETVASRFLRREGLYAPPREATGGVIRLGSKIFGEQFILTEIYRMLIRGHTNLDVETKTGLGGTKICFDALINGEIDLYPEYTGTGLLVLLKPSAETKRELMRSAVKVYAYVSSEFLKQYRIQWLEPIGFNNAYALMMRREQAQRLNIKTISDLKRYLEE